MVFCAFLLGIVTSTETFKSAVLYENKGLFLGKKMIQSAIIQDPQLMASDFKELRLL